ncbi:MAG: hypothetical protein ACI4JC_01105 [Faecalibacterium sp.]
MLTANSTFSLGGKEYRPGEVIVSPIDSKAATEMIASGYIVKSGDEDCLVVDVDKENPDGTVSGHVNRDSLEGMTKAQLQKLAEDMGIYNADLNSKAKLVEAISSANLISDTPESE